MTSQSKQRFERIVRQQKISSSSRGGPCSGGRSGVCSQSSPDPTPNEHLNLIPHLDDHWWVAGFADEAINAGCGGADSFASEGGLIVALTQEMGKNKRREKGVLEGDGPKKDADEDNELGVRDNFHCSVIIRFDPCLQPLRNWVRGGGGHRRKQVDQVQGIEASRSCG